MAEVRSGTAAAVAGESGATCPTIRPEPHDRQLVTIDELRALRDAHEPVTVLDVRTARTYDPSDATASGAVRLDPEAAVREARARGVPKEAWLVAYCA